MLGVESWLTVLKEDNIRWFVEMADLHGGQRKPDSSVEISRSSAIAISFHCSFRYSDARDGLSP